MFTQSELRTFEALLASRIKKDERSAANKKPRGDGFVFDLALSGVYQTNVKLLAKVREQIVPNPGTQWCPVCKAYHAEPGEKTDAGRLVKQCLLLDPDDLRNRLENYR